mmetsp:Transcript_62601/g.130090  ORF Transcript_62601/g.130090 Transcript_62601/m.130090 type:complete len:291 (-) Transcript_62601:265-1137(-)
MSWPPAASVSESWEEMAEKRPSARLEPWAAWAAFFRGGAGRALCCRPPVRRVERVCIMASSRRRESLMRAAWSLACWAARLSDFLSRCSPERRTWVRSLAWASKAARMRVSLLLEASPSDGAGGWTGGGSGSWAGCLSLPLELLCSSARPSGPGGRDPPLGGRPAMAEEDGGWGAPPSVAGLATLLAALEEDRAWEAERESSRARSWRSWNADRRMAPLSSSCGTEGGSPGQREKEPSFKRSKTASASASFSKRRSISASSTILDWAWPNFMSAREYGLKKPIHEERRES